MPDTAIRAGAPSRRERRGGLPPLPLQRTPPRPLLAGRRRPQHAGPQPLCPPAGPDAGRGAAGKWTDAATGEHGDLLDLIAASRRLPRVRGRARRGAALPRPAAGPSRGRPCSAARRIAAKPRGACSPWHEPIAGHAGRDLSAARAASPVCATRRRCAFTRAASTARTTAAGRHARGLAGADRRRHRPRRHDHRACSAPGSTRPAAAKAPVADAAAGDGPPARQRGPVRRRAHDIMAAGEGIETMLSLRSVLPTLPLAAALSANHLAALLLPVRAAPALHRARQRPRRATGRRTRWRAGAGGRDRGARAGADAGRLQRRPAAARPRCARGGVRAQLAPEDVARFWRPPSAANGPDEHGAGAHG